jgi:sugar phosphate permease
VVSRLVSGAICDRIGGLRTLLLGSMLQGLSLLLFIPFDSLASLYIISALFGLFQGGIVPSYAIIVREYFPAAEAGQRWARSSWPPCSAWRWAAGCRARSST